MKKTLLLSLALIVGAATMAQSKVGTQLLSQDFTTAATGWTFDTQAANWVTSASANAGGVAPEAKMKWDPQFNGTTRLISPVIDASGHSNLNIEFKHAIDHYSGAYTIGLATRSNAGAWHIVWSRSGATVVESINVVIENEDLGSSSFQFCLFFSGSSYNINAWYIDDILLYAPFETDLAVNSINNEAYSLFGNRTVAATVKNVGINPITSFEIQYQVNEEAVITENVTGISITSGSSYSHTFTSVWEATAGTYNVSVGLTNINGNGDDDDMSNNSKTKSISCASQTVANIPLYESFTSSTCGPCNSFNTGSFTPFLNAHAGELAIIKYQMNWPGSGDPYYTAEGGVRRGYYGVNGVPALFAGGSAIPTSATGLTNAFNTLTAKGAFFELGVNATITEGNIVFATINILPHISVNNFKLHAAIVERETTGNVGSNGEKSFKYVMMKMLPNANGTVFSSTDGEAFSFDLAADLTSTHVEGFDDLMIVVFIQNDETKEVFQSAMADVTANIDGYTVTYNVKNSLTDKAVEGAKITIEDKEATTNGEGKAYMLLANGSYNFNVAKEHFVSQTGDFTITDANTIVNISLVPIKYAVNFSVLDNATDTPIEGASIVINEEVLTTSNLGVATIMLLSDTYTYSISMDDYQTVTKSLKVVGEMSVTEKLNAEHTITFTVTNAATAPIEGATVTINTKTLSTNNSGITEIKLINGSYPYSVVKTGFDKAEGTVVVNNENDEISIILTPTVSVSTSPLSTLSIYPNPTQGEVTIKMAKEEKVNTIEIYSITGALVYSKIYNASLSEVKMNINQPQGVYMVRVTLNNGNTSIGKLIVK